MRKRMLLIVVGCALLQCAPVVPQRTKLGGAARWAYDIAQQRSILWASDAELSRIVGVGVGTDGWLPDRGGNWILTFWSPQRTEVLEVSVDSDGHSSTTTLADSPHRGSSIPFGWKDSSSIWAATMSHQTSEPLSTFDSELSFNAAAERYPEQTVWRLRFYLAQGGFETHVVSPSGTWLGKY